MSQAGGVGYSYLSSPFPIFNHTRILMYTTKAIFSNELHPLLHRPTPHSLIIISVFFCINFSTISLLFIFSTHPNRFSHTKYILYPLILMAMFVAVKLPLKYSFLILCNLVTPFHIHFSAHSLLRLSFFISSKKTEIFKFLKKR